MKPDVFWIPGTWQGKLAIIARPRGGDWLADEAGAWREAGLDVVVSLLEKDEASQLELGQEAAVSKSKGIQFISFPIPDRGVPKSARDVLSLLNRMRAKLEEGKNVAIHCRQSVGRSGLVAAALLVTAGMSASQAIDVVSAARGQTIPETDEQLQWIQRVPSESSAPVP